MPRYEFKEGTSNKFWEITLDGETFTTRWGKIGSAGQTATKEWDSRGEARREYDKIIASKVKSGYVLVGGDDRPASKTNPELEAAIEVDPANPAPYLVFADWLQAQGDARGELIVVQHALSTAEPARQGELRERERALLSANREAWLGAADDEDYADLSWRFGFVRSARLRTEYDAAFDVAEATEALLSSPVGSFLEDLTLGLANAEGENEYQSSLDVLVNRKPGSLRKLFIGDFEQEESEISWSDIGNMGPVWSALPRLERLTLHSGAMKLGAIVAPELLELAIQTGGLPASEMHSIVQARWPKLEKLEVWFGVDNYGGDCAIADVAPLLEGAFPASLRHLGLMNALFTDEIVDALVGSKVLKQIKSLDLSMGCMTAAGVATLKKHREAFRHLTRLNLSNNCIEEEALSGLDDVCAGVTYDDQSPDRNSEDYRYTAVTE